MKTITDEKVIKKLQNLYDLNGAELERINLFGIRNEEKKNLSIWNDALGMYDQKTGIIYLGEGTTDPSRWWTLHHGKGVDNLIVGYHHHLWAIGNHRGHKAFSQGPRKVTTIRDTNRNYELDPDDTIVHDRAWWGIDMHTTYRPIKTLGIIGKASAGCQVWKHWREFHAIRDKAESTGQELFSYLLMPLKEENQYFFDAVYGG